MKPKAFLALFLCIMISILFGIRCGAIEIKNDSVASDNEKRVALSFDDGPHPIYTKRILNILSKYNVTATFFVIGINVKNYNEAFAAIVDSGCEIGNHTYYHTRLKGESREKIKNELMMCQEQVEKYCGAGHIKLVRPPQGAYNSDLSAVAEEFDYSIALWSIDTLDWSLRPSREIVDHVLSSVKDGDIILMHDYVSGKSTTCDALEVIIPELINRGYTFVTVSEMLGY